MKRIRTILTSMMLVFGASSMIAASAVPAFAAVDPQAEICKGTGGTGGAGGCSGNTTGNTGDLKTIFTTIVNILLFIIGAVAVIMIIVGAFRFVTSAGNSSSVTAAKNTILYAVVGLVVAILAFAIVNFVVGSLVK